MAEMLSPGVFVTEIDASTIAPTVSNSIGVFAGNFSMGPVESYTLITSVDELIAFYGLPNNDNYNEWYQAYNFLQYGNKLYVSRVVNANSGFEAYNAGVVVGDVQTSTVGATSEAFGSSVGTLVDSVASAGTLVTIAGDVTSSVSAGDVVAIDVDGAGGAAPGVGDPILTVSAVVYDAADTQTLITFTTAIGTDVTNSSVLYAYVAATDGTTSGTEGTTVSTYAGQLVKNFDEFENTTFAFPDDDKLLLLAQSAGTWGNDITVAIAIGGTDANTGLAGDFGQSNDAFVGISLDDQFEYIPSEGEYGIVVKKGSDIVEVFTVSLDETAKDHNGKSMFIENVINNGSSYIYAAVDGGNANGIASKIGADAVALASGTAVAGGADELATAYDLWNNKEEVDIDIIIANEVDAGVSAKNLADARKDCIAFIGAEYGDTVGKKASEAVTALTTWRKTGNANYNNMFVVACGNYKYQYDRYNDKNRWINVAGDIAGLRAATSSNRASWWASAGLERGQIKNVKKLAFNPNQGHRDILYKNSINPICSFPGQGTVMWGFVNGYHVKTLLNCWNILRAA